MILVGGVSTRDAVGPSVTRALSGIAHHSRAPMVSELFDPDRWEPVAELNDEFRGFIGAGWYFSQKVSDADEYILGSGKLGVAFGMTSLLAFWITGNTMLAAPESAYLYGVIGAAGYGLTGGLAVILFGMLSKRIHQIIPHGKTVGDYYRASTRAHLEKRPLEPLVAPGVCVVVAEVPLLDSVFAHVVAVAVVQWLVPLAEIVVANRATERVRVRHTV